MGFQTVMPYTLNCFQGASQSSHTGPAQLHLDPVTPGCPSTLRTLPAASPPYPSMPSSETAMFTPPAPAEPEFAPRHSTTNPPLEVEAQRSPAACPRSQFTGTWAGLEVWHLGSNSKFSSLPVNASDFHQAYRNPVIKCTNFQVT